MTSRPLLSLIVLLGLSCSASPYESPTQKLQDAVTRYNHSVRWRNFEVAAQFVPQDKRDDYLAERADDQDAIKVLEYKLDEVRYLGDEERRAEVVVTFTYHQRFSNIVERATFLQDWRYGIGRAWTIAGQKKIERKPKERKLESRF